MIHQSERQEEFRKRLESVLLAGDRTLLIDNCDRAVGGAALDALLTDTEMDVRILGVSENVKTPTNIFLSASGNHFQVFGDTVRRVLVATIEPRGSDPENATFDFNPKVETKRRRAEMVAAAITVMRAHFVAGRPGPKWASTYGSFETWSRLVRAPIVWLLGEDHDPKLTTKKQKDGDPVTASRAALLVAIKDAVGVDVPFSASEIKAQGGGEIPSGGLLWEELYLHLMAATDRDTWVPQAVGGVLTRNSGRLTDGMRLDTGERGKHGMTYFLREP